MSDTHLDNNPILNNVHTVIHMKCPKTYDQKKATQTT